jgi:hypothetical protein
MPISSVLISEKGLDNTLTNSTILLNYHTVASEGCCRSVMYLFLKDGFLLASLRISKIIILEMEKLEKEDKMAGQVFKLWPKTAVYHSSTPFLLLSQRFNLYSAKKLLTI